MKDGTVGLYLFTDRDRPAVEGLGAAPELIERLIRERDQGSGYSFVIRDRADVVGYYWVSGIGGGEAREVGGRVGPSFRRQGYGTFGLGMLLEFLFQNQRLDRVFAKPAESDDDRAAWIHLLGNHGFAVDAVPPMLARDRWKDLREGPKLAALHPGLRAILEAELAAGNEIAEAGGGWPDPDSVFIRLRNPFQPRPARLPPDVEFLAVDDPHWWMAEYHSRKPRHLLVY
jgi:hypothetical protein